MQWGHLEERYARKFCFKPGKNATETYGILQTAFRPFCMNRATVFEWWEVWEEQKKSDHQSWLAKGLGLGLPSWSFKGVQEEIPSDEVSGISTRTMHQSTTPSLSKTIWPSWASRQFLSLPIVETLLPVTFGYSLSSEAVVMRQLRRWKRLWRRSLTRTHMRTSIGPSRSC